MIRNYLTSALRNLHKYPAFSFINIAGLAIGMTACLLISCYVYFELSYDDFHSKADRIYRLTTTVSTPTETFVNAITNYPNGPNITHDFPEVESFVRVADVDLSVKVDDLKIHEPSALAADSSFFGIFDFPLRYGDRSTVLREPFSIVLSESGARKFFGIDNPVGHDLTFTLQDTVFTARVTGVMKDMPSNSQFRGDLIISLSTITAVLGRESVGNWTNHHPRTYLLLKSGTDAVALESKLPAYLERHIGGLMDQLQMHYTLNLHPLKKVYLTFGDYRYAGQTGNITHVYIFLAVAFLVLLAACFNFINLSTARALGRAREVGVRKVIGAGRGQLTGQFLGESVLISLAAMVVAVILSAMLLPLFNQLAGKTVATGLLHDFRLPILLLTGALAVGVFAGIYPAWVLSAFKPVQVLKSGSPGSGRSGGWLRKGLVIGQIALSLALIIATLTVYHQMDYMRSFPLGFRKDQVLVIDGHYDAGLQKFRNALGDLSGVHSASLSSSVPGQDHTSAYSEIENSKGELQQSNVDLYFVDFDYFDLYGLEVVAGRPFSKEFRTDSTQAMILNESAVASLGYTESGQAIGKRFKQWGREGLIVGVVRNFHYHGLHQSIEPLSIRIDPGNFRFVSINLPGGNIPATLGTIRELWNATLPNQPFSYSFLDESFDSQYRTDERFGNLFFYFSVLAIFISVLGMLGLIAYSTRQRTREIGVRKVFGASVASVVGLVSRDFLLLAGVAAFIAIPVAWIAMDRWLESFAYHKRLSWPGFIISVLLMLLIMMVTISFHTLKVALMNPVKTLRNE